MAFNVKCIYLNQSTGSVNKKPEDLCKPFAQMVTERLRVRKHSERLKLPPHYLGRWWCHNPDREHEEEQMVGDKTAHSLQEPTLESDHVDFISDPAT